MIWKFTAKGSWDDISLNEAELVDVAAPPDLNDGQKFVLELTVCTHTVLQLLSKYTAHSSGTQTKFEKCCCR